MIVRTIIASALLAAFSSAAYAVLIGPFPGLDKAIEIADVIAIVRIDEHVQAAADDNLITRHRCYVYQTLKGDLKAGEVVPLDLTDTLTNFVSPFPLHSSHLVFLIKTDRGYRNLSFEGSILRLSPFGLEKIPNGETLQAKIRSLVRQSIAHWDAEWNSERNFLQEIAQ